MAIINLELIRNKDQEIAAEPSEYKPSEEVIAITDQVLEDYSAGEIIRNQPYREFNNMTLLDRQSRDQMAWNTFEPSESSDPDEEWRSTAVRPITRNKLISIAAHITGQVIYPNIFAQNRDDKEDKAAASVMKDLMLWTGEQADYERNFLYAVIAALVNPATILHTEFRKVFRTVKVKDEKGDIIPSEIVDEEQSGIKYSLVPVDELWIENIYESDIQKQGFLVWRRVINYSLAQVKYRDNENFKKFVRPGIQIMMGDDKRTFYEQYDDELQDRLVEEIIYYNRQLDLQLVFVNGVIMTPHNEPNPRQDKKYPFGKGGYELIDEGKFFYYKSAAFKIAPDADVVDILYRMVIDGTYLNIMPPGILFGEEIIDAGVIKPAAITNFKSEGTKFETLKTGSDLIAGYNALDKVESSISESTEAPRGGVGEPGEQTAFEIARLEQNARINLGLFGKMVGFLVKDFGKLVLGDIIQHLTVGEMSEITGDNAPLKFRSFLVPDTKAGMNDRIIFDTEVSEEPITEEEQLKSSFGIMEEEGGIDSDERISRVNPLLFRSLKFMVKVSPDVIFPPSENVKRALNLEQYDRAVGNPLADQKAIYQELLLGAYPATRNDPDKFTVKRGSQTPEQLIKGGTGGRGSPLAKIMGAEGKAREAETVMA